MSIEELNGCELGTKIYWEKSYEREIKNYKNNGDVGEIWFDEDAQQRIIDYILNNEEITKNYRIIDLGCGNGMFLIELARHGYKNLYGVDYAPNAIELANNIAKDQDLNIKYAVADLMNVTACERDLGQFDVIHDKGTYDAISLAPNNAKQQRELYIETVTKLMHKNTLFIITSCNWTEDELLLIFLNKFIKIYTIPTPTFHFGGKIGNIVSSIVFKLK